jgi:predicted nucleotidyltransferase
VTDKELLDYVNSKIGNQGKLLFLTKSGSHLYGTNVETSDTDYVGIFIGNMKNKIGFNKTAEIDCSIISKDENGKNTQHAIDIKLFEFEKFLRLAGDVNPNIVELLFAHSNEKAIIFNTDEFKIIEENYELFINRRVKHSFQGYAKQQFKKGIMKAQNYNLLKNVLDILEKYDDKEILAVVIEKENELKKYDKGSLLELNGLSFQKNIFVKKIKGQIENKLKMASHRVEMWKKHGYDTKFFMHLFRLLDEGKMLVENRKLEFPLKDVEFLLDIRKGKYKLEELQDLAEKKFEEFNNLDFEKLPKKANWNKIEELMIDLYKKYWFEEN